MATITHQKVDGIPSWDATDLANAKAGNPPAIPPSATIADIVLSEDWNADHTFVLGADENFVTDAELTSIGTALQTVSVDGVTITGNGTPGSPLVAASGGTGILQFIDMYLGNQIFSGAVFGYFRVPAGYSFRCREVQITAMTVPDTNVVLDFIDSNGLPVSNTVALPALSRAKSNILTSPLLMAASSSWAMKVLSCGTEAPGENLNARLVLELQS